MNTQPSFLKVSNSFQMVLVYYIITFLEITKFTGLKLFSITKYRKTTKQGVPLSRELLNLCLSHLMKKNFTNGITLQVLQAFLMQCLEIADLKNSDLRPEKLKPSRCHQNSDPKKSLRRAGFKFVADSSRSLLYCSLIQCCRQNLLREGGRESGVVDSSARITKTIPNIAWFCFGFFVSMNHLIIKCNYLSRN